MKKIICYILLTVTTACAAFARSPKELSHLTTPPHLDTATLATGCFWCTEAKFKELRGVVKVTSGFAGGHTVNPTYEQVCTGTTGHAEACNIVYDPKQISYDELLQVFFTDHDPTQLNRQGNDVGTQYRSAIFYHNATQKQKAEYYIKKINEEKAYPKPVVTQVVPFTVFYKAEGYHQNYFSKNGSVPYCKYVIQPELDKFRKAFADKLKTSK
ncbi:peptide-methionine (S)-S-oxide reductase MsrA [Mucilaginibacter jinjuensis]|uniref:Peptide methionine sulfoxide reductase MsrA n=1 Tax=Mucilaginibacter jinjuensis TaxID=1176721 RepID=A0ABY7TF88_9SPHI|nr:peptide-methionine (S)-S-oxide reductase MsrA [Mucilaginibacter jinjuensis]WCT14277.1 peptide-methionine (S)-S-oxide reductase MsrA [Mucilaginibacter jinjuensis]